MKAESIPSISHQLPNKLQTNCRLLILAGSLSTPLCSHHLACSSNCPQASLTHAYNLAKITLRLRGVSTRFLLSYWGRTTFEEEVDQIDDVAGIYYGISIDIAQTRIRHGSALEDEIDQVNDVT